MSTTPFASEWCQSTNGGPAAEKLEWDCAICEDDLRPFATSKPCIIHTNDDGTHLVCAECLRTRFLSARESESSYPVKWQTQILHPRAFPHAFDRDFVAAYEIRELEYLAPAQRRVYCDCGTFMAPMVVPEAAPSWRSSNSRFCSGCEIRWCLRCAQKCYGYGLRHACEPDRKIGGILGALGKLKRGQDWQRCPREECGTVIELAQACNSMLCICGRTFCFVCGQPAEDGSWHWTEGGCPRWGVPGSGAEQHDTVEDEDEDGEEDDDDDEEGQVETPWQRGEGEPTVFNFYRWAWGAAMLEGTVYEAQVRAASGQLTEDGIDIDFTNILWAMVQHNPASRSGVDHAGWMALLEAHAVDAVRDLVGMLLLSEDVGLLGAAHVDNGPGRDLMVARPERIFNVAIAADREAGAQWAREASIIALAMMVHVRMPGANVHPDLLRFPGPAVFDVGPGGAWGESWRIRDMEMFEDAPGLGFWRLAGNALLVMPFGGNGHPDENLARAAARVEQASLGAPPSRWRWRTN